MVREGGIDAEGNCHPNHGLDDAGRRIIIPFHPCHPVDQNHAGYDTGHGTGGPARLSSRHSQTPATQTTPSISALTSG